MLEGRWDAWRQLEYSEEGCMGADELPGAQVCAQGPCPCSNTFPFISLPPRQESHGHHTPRSCPPITHCHREPWARSRTRWAGSCRSKDGPCPMSPFYSHFIPLSTQWGADGAGRKGGDGEIEMGPRGWAGMTSTKAGVLAGKGSPCTPSLLVASGTPTLPSP